MNSRAMREMRKFINSYWKEGMTVLDVGSWQKDEQRTFRELVTCGYLGIDIRPGPNVDIVTEPYKYPFGDNFFDLVISGSTLEHVGRFWEVFREMVRVTKTAMCIIVPSYYPKIHKYPIDCWRFLPDGMKVLAGTCDNVKLIKAYLKKPHTCVGIYEKENKCS